MNKYLFLLAIFFSLLALSQNIVFADGNCKPLYGGGVTTDQACPGKKLIAPVAKATPTPTPTPVKAKPSSTPPKVGTTTKGGFPVMSPTTQKTTPSTGPELLGILGLLPAGALGLYLRKKG